MINKILTALLSLVALLALSACVPVNDNNDLDNKTNQKTQTQYTGSDMNKGEQAFKRGDYTHAFKFLYPQAMKGNEDAQYAVGYMIYYGKGVTRNEEIGSAWIREAAVQGQENAEKAMRLLTRKGMFDITGTKLKQG